MTASTQNLSLVIDNLAFSAVLYLLGDAAHVLKLIPL
jgi:hypothetical protein